MEIKAEGDSSRFTNYVKKAFLDLDGRYTLYHGTSSDPVIRYAIRLVSSKSDKVTPDDIKHVLDAAVEYIRKVDPKYEAKFDPHNNGNGNVVILVQSETCKSLISQVVRDNFASRGLASRILDDGLRRLFNLDFTPKNGPMRR